jgi:hypothetical protein
VNFYLSPGRGSTHILTTYAPKRHTQYDAFRCDDGRGWWYYPEKHESRFFHTMGATDAVDLLEGSKVKE